MPPVHGDQLSSRLDAYTGHEAESVDSARGVHVGNANGPAVDSTYWAKPQADTRSFLEPTDQDQLDDTEAQIPSFCNFETDLNECRVADNANVETFVGFGKARKIANFENTAPPADRHTNPTIHVQPYDLRSLARTPSVNYFQIPTDEELEPPQKRRRTRQSNRGPPKPIFNGVERRVCSEMDCGKFVPINRDGPRCTRCHQKWIKNTTGPQHVDFDPSIEMSQAYDLVYTPQPPLKMEYGLEDDVAGQTIASTASDRWMTFLFDSINSPYVVQETHTHEWIHSNFLTQQQVYNKKFFDQPEQYNRRMINARLRFLFEAARRFHAGGPLVYDDGGDNAGYSVNKSITFSERMIRICALLKQDKRIVMDVIEGRGINAFVRDPDGYERRKMDNVMSNGKKKAAKAAHTARSTPLEQQALGTGTSCDGLESHGAAIDPALLGSTGEPSFAEESEPTALPGLSPHHIGHHGSPLSGSIEALMALSPHGTWKESPWSLPHASLATSGEQQSRHGEHAWHFGVPCGDGTQSSIFAAAEDSHQTTHDEHGILNHGIDWGNPSTW